MQPLRTYYLRGCIFLEIKMNLFRDFVDGKISRAQVLDFVINSLSAQGRLSKGPDGGRSYYRLSGKVKCAVGVLLSEEDYKPIIEMSNVVTLYREKYRNYGDIDPETDERLMFLTNIQNIHDSANTFVQCIDGLKEVRATLT